MIYSLNQEKENELKIIDEDLENELKKMIYYFKHMDIRDNKDVEILEEKFRFNVFNSIGEMFDLINKK